MKVRVNNKTETCCHGFKEGVVGEIVRICNPFGDPIGLSVHSRNNREWFHCKKCVDLIK